jgi:hypothetical protein
MKLTIILEAFSDAKSKQSEADHGECRRLGRRALSGNPCGSVKRENAVVVQRRVVHRPIRGAPHVHVAKDQKSAGTRRICSCRIAHRGRLAGCVGCAYEGPMRGQISGIDLANVGALFHVKSGSKRSVEEWASAIRNRTIRRSGREPKIRCDAVGERIIVQKNQVPPLRK